MICIVKLTYRGEGLSPFIRKPIVRIQLAQLQEKAIVNAFFVNEYFFKVKKRLSECLIFLLFCIF